MSDANATHGVVGSRSWTLAAALIVGLWSSLVATATDPPPGKKDGLPSAAKRRQETELEHLSKEAAQLEEAGKLPEAVAAAEKATRLARGLEGDVSETVARWQERLAQLYERREEWQPAGQARQDVLAIRTKLYGEKDWRVTDARLELEKTIRLSRLGAAPGACQGDFVEPGGRSPAPEETIWQCIRVGRECAGDPQKSPRRDGSGLRHKPE
jgi:hypothetical protein